MDYKSKFKVGDLVVVKKIPNEVWKVDTIHYGVVNFYIVINTKTSLPYFCAEFEIELAEELKLIGSKFKPGGIVTVDGYIGQFEVIECNGYEPMVEDIVYRLINIHTGEEVFGAELDMKLFGKKNEIHVKLNVETGYIKQLPKKKPQPNKPPRHRTLESGIIAKLEHNKHLVEKGKQMIDDYLNLYSNFGDEKYLRRIKRISNFINKIPVRAFQIDN